MQNKALDKIMCKTIQIRMNACAYVRIVDP